VLSDDYLVAPAVDDLLQSVYNVKVFILIIVAEVTSVKPALIVYGSSCHFRKI
jgi:hypothetical protein